MSTLLNVAGILQLYGLRTTGTTPWIQAANMTEATISTTNISTVRATGANTAMVGTTDAIGKRTRARSGLATFRTISAMANVGTTLTGLTAMNSNAKTAKKNLASRAKLRKVYQAFSTIISTMLKSW